MSSGTFLLVTVAGGAGSALRWLVDDAVRRRCRHDVPVGIFVVNVSGSLLIGLLAGVVTGAAGSVALTGLIGGYTTFSTWMLDTHNALTARRTAVAIVNVLGSLGAGLLAVAVGTALAERL
ncbi:MAG: CrcB family protein [Patulibacter sp.]